MTYLISHQELKELASGQITIDDLTKPENIALFTWSGADVEGFIKEDNLTIETDEGFVNDVAHRLSNTELGDIVQTVVQEVAEELGG